MRRMSRATSRGIAAFFGALLDELGEALAAFLVRRAGIECSLADDHVAVQISVSNAPGSTSTTRMPKRMGFDAQ